MTNNQLSKGVTLNPGVDDPASVGISFGPDWRNAMHTINAPSHSHAIATFGDTELRDRIVACVNACAGIPTEALEMIASRFPSDDGARLRLLSDVAREER